VSFNVPCVSSLQRLPFRTSARTTRRSREFHISRFCDLLPHKHLKFRPRRLCHPHHSPRVPANFEVFTILSYLPVCENFRKFHGTHAPALQIISSIPHPFLTPFHLQTRTGSAHSRHVITKDPPITRTVCTTRTTLSRSRPALPRTDPPLHPPQSLILTCLLSLVHHTTTTTIYRAGVAKAGSASSALLPCLQNKKQRSVYTWQSVLQK